MTKQHTTDERNFNACMKHQDSEVFGSYGQRGCEDCVFTHQLVSDFAERITPEKMHFDDPILAEHNKEFTSAFNAAIDQMEQNKKKELGE